MDNDDEKDEAKKKFEQNLLNEINEGEAESH